MARSVPVGERRTRRHRRPRVLRSAGLSLGVVLGAVLVLSGCAKTGVAATVNERTIRVEMVQSATGSLREADKQAFGSVTDSQVLSVLLYGPMAEAAASAAGKGVSDFTVRSAILASAQQNGDKTVRPLRLNADALQVLRGLVAFNQLDDAAKHDILTELQKADVSVAPRYGTFNRANGSINAPNPNWLQPTASPSATPSASPSATG